MNKLEWIQEELRVEEYYPSIEGIRKVLAGEDTNFDDSLIDMIEELSDEWEDI